MRCPFCKKDRDKVVDSRSASDGFLIRRRRECLDCARRYTTFERVEESPLRVIKKDGSRVAFDRAKIRAGIQIACEKRPVPTEELEAIVNRIEREIHETHEKEVPSSVIGQLVMDELSGIDQVAYVRFASVYREFKDAKQFMDELHALLAKSGVVKPAERRPGAAGGSGSGPPGRRDG